MSSQGRRPMAKRLRNAGRPAPAAARGPATLTEPPQVSALPVARIPRHGTPPAAPPGSGPPLVILLLIDRFPGSHAGCEGVGLLDSRPLFSTVTRWNGSYPVRQAQRSRLTPFEPLQ